jgi:hypothetical protein
MDTPPPAPMDASTAPESDAPPAPTDDAAAVPSTNDATPSMGMNGDATGGDEPSKRSDYMAEVQKYAGKLGQELRDLHDRMESDDIKYVLNMIISAVNLDKLSDEDIEEIGKKFDRDEEEGGEQIPSGEETPEEQPAAEPTPDTDLGEEVGMNKLDEFIKSPNLGEISLDSYLPKEEDETKELDMDEIHNQISSAVKETLGKYFK